MSDTPSPLAARILALLQQPTFFWQVIDALSDQTYRATLEAWSEVREGHDLDRDEHGRYWLKTAP
ncbi:hypothetical protein ABLE93_19530 [Xanthobacter sp. KR7-65]|uniref:hypothetical protein n=1 Tax=Xanthobacter sp. KR7-65 TaxID=3156612 RepID=UPI0032B58477